MMSPRPDRPLTVAGLAPIFSASHRISEQPCSAHAAPIWPCGPVHGAGERRNTFTPAGHALHNLVQLEAGQTAPNTCTLQQAKTLDTDLNQGPRRPLTLT